MPQDRTDNYELFLTIEELGKAIARQKKVRFQYREYGMDKKLHPRTREDGTPRVSATTRQPLETLKWSNGSTLDLAAYMKEHPYMYAGENVHAKLRIVRAMVGDMIDIFGKDIRFSDERDGYVTVAVYANEVAVGRLAGRLPPRCGGAGAKEGEG